MNKQREIIYGQRNKVLDGEDISETIKKMIVDTVTESVNFYCPATVGKHEWNISGLASKYAWLATEDELESIGKNKELTETLTERALKLYDDRRAAFGDEFMGELERMGLLRNVDMRWMDHIDAMEELKKGISLRAYAQKDPAVAFREESFDMFDEMTNDIREGTVNFVLLARVKTNEEIKREQQAKITSASGAGGDTSEKKAPIKKGAKVGRNDPCPCGSGKKYKKCCGANEQ